MRISWKLLTGRYRVMTMSRITRAITDKDAVEVVCYVAVPRLVLSLESSYLKGGYSEFNSGNKKFKNYAPTFSSGKSKGKQVTEQPFKNSTSAFYAILGSSRYVDPPRPTRLRRIFSLTWMKRLDHVQIGAN